MSKFVKFLSPFVSVNLFTSLLVGIGMWFENVPWRNWYLFMLFAVIGMWIYLLILTRILVAFHEQKK